MNRNTWIIIGVIALFVIIGGVYASMANKSDSMMVKEEMGEKVTDEKMMDDKSVMMDKVDTGISDNKDDMAKSGSYEVYSADKIAMAEKGDVVIFFHASWCPSCRGLNADIEKNAGSIPSGVTILKADYDKETELKKKYGVTSQHTLVQVDKDGGMIKKWSGGGTLSSTLSQIQ